MYSMCTFRSWAEGSFGIACEMLTTCWLIRLCDPGIRGCTWSSLSVARIGVLDQFSARRWWIGEIATRLPSKPSDWLCLLGRLSRGRRSRASLSFLVRLSLHLSLSCYSSCCFSSLCMVHTWRFRHHASLEFVTASQSPRFERALASWTPSDATGKGMFFMSQSCPWSSWCRECLGRCDGQVGCRLWVIPYAGCGTHEHTAWHLLPSQPSLALKSGAWLSSAQHKLSGRDLQPFRRKVSRGLMTLTFTWTSTPTCHPVF